MGQLIDDLMRLNGLDQELRRLREQLEAGPARIRAAEENLEALRAAQKEKEDLLHQTRAQADARSVDVQEREGQIGKLKGQLNICKTNAEYNATQKQIDGIEAERESLELEALELMESVDTVKVEVAEARKAVGGTEAKLAEDRGEVESELAGVRDREEKLAGERDAFSRNIDEDILPVYNRILERRPNGALAGAKDMACQACFVKMPPQDFNLTIQAKQVVRCKSCGRILYFVESNEYDD